MIFLKKNIIAVNQILQKQYNKQYKRGLTKASFILNKIVH